MKRIMATGEPFFFAGGPVGCLLVHGFTGTPKEMRWLGEYLADKGYTSLGVRLFGHTTQPEDMMRARWYDWIASVEDGYHLLRGVCDEVVILGLSMGGALSLLFASHNPVAGVVAMSTIYKLPPDPRLPFIRLLSPVMRFVAKGPSDWHDAEAERDHISYPEYPTRAVITLGDLLKEMQGAVTNLTVPVLLIHSHGDLAVDPASASELLEAIGSSDKTLMWVENSGHVITRDAEREQVFTAAEAFIGRVTGEGK